ncbi:hypothetical protein [Arachidicoccus ginsenosidimutans]|nr:hypothetical protein [Arachidicoccus sp. BS20]
MSIIVFCISRSFAKGKRIVHFLNRYQNYFHFTQQQYHQVGIL